MIISGAFSSIRRLSRLFLFITLLYKSLRSEVANRPPSNGTRGLSSGGMTGTIVIIIHSGLFPELKNASTTFNLFASFIGFSSEVDSSISTLKSSASFSRSSPINRSLIASAPIPTVNASSPYSSL